MSSWWAYCQERSQNVASATLVRDVVCRRRRDFFAATWMDGGGGRAVFLSVCCILSRRVAMMLLARFTSFVSFCRFVRSESDAPRFVRLRFNRGMGALDFASWRRSCRSFIFRGWTERTHGAAARGAWRKEKFSAPLGLAPLCAMDGRYLDSALGLERVSAHSCCAAERRSWSERTLAAFEDECGLHV